MSGNPFGFNPNQYHPSFLRPDAPALFRRPDLGRYQNLGRLYGNNPYAMPFMGLNYPQQSNPLQSLLGLGGLGSLLGLGSLGGGQQLGQYPNLSSLLGLGGFGNNPLLSLLMPFLMPQQSIFSLFSNNLLHTGLQQLLGEGTSVDLEGGAKNVTLAAILGDSKSQGLLGALFVEGLGVPKSMKQAADWFQKSADQGDPRGQYGLSMMHFGGLGGKAKDDSKVFSLLTKASDNGDLSSKARLALLYERGIGVTADPAKAFSFAKAAAEGDNAIGQTALGHLYAKGIGTDKDLEKALTWYLKGAEQKGTAGKKALGNFYVDEQTPPNYEQAAVWYKKAIDDTWHLESGRSKALPQLFLADLHKKGQVPIALSTNSINDMYLEGLKDFTQINSTDIRLMEPAERTRLKEIVTRLSSPDSDFAEKYNTLTDAQKSRITLLKSRLETV